MKFSPQVRPTNDGQFRAGAANPNGVIAGTPRYFDSEEDAQAYAQEDVADMTCFWEAIRRPGKAKPLAGEDRLPEKDTEKAVAFSTVNGTAYIPRSQCFFNDRYVTIPSWLWEREFRRS